MQNIIFTFAYLMAFLWLLAIVWTIVSELFTYVNIKIKLTSKVKSSVTRAYRQFMILQQRKFNLRKLYPSLNKRLSHN